LSYNADFTGSNKDLVRWLIGDTDEDNEVVTDQEINNMLAVENDDAERAAGRLLTGISLDYANKLKTVFDNASGVINMSNLSTDMFEKGRTLMGA